MSGRATRRSRGFTLIEMMLVITTILILLGIAMPIYSHSIMRVREENLRKNLDTLNTAIYQYTQDKQKPPHSLQDLQAAGYIASVPEDINGSTWETESGEDTIMTVDQTEPGGIIGVHSGCKQMASDGTEYSKW